MVKRFFAIIITICVILCSLPAFADYMEYNESALYSELADRISGNEYIGAFVDYKTLVDRHLQKLTAMNSAERQQLITEILTDAGKIYASGEDIDFTDGELAEYLAYAAANVAEAKNYLKANGMSSIADVPLTVDLGSESSVKVTFFKSYLATAYNSGVSDILIKNCDIGVMIDITELAAAVDGKAVSVSLMRHQTDALADDYKNAARSDAVYQLIISDGAEITDVLLNSKLLLYGSDDEDKVYSLIASERGIMCKPVSTEYDGNILSLPVNNLRWFGTYNLDSLSSTFSDVPPEHWAYEYVESLATAGIIAGNNGAFNPEGNVTREEFVKMLVEALNINAADEKCTFEDVPENEWYYEYVASAYNSGIANGIKQNRFGIGESISRQDIAVMAVRALDYKQIYLEPALSYYGYFFDGESISDYAQDAVMTMYVSGFVTGDEDYRFNPHSPATRAEVAKIIYMIIERI